MICGHPIGGEGCGQKVECFKCVNPNTNVTKVGQDVEVSVESSVENVDEKTKNDQMLIEDCETSEGNKLDKEINQDTDYRPNDEQATVDPINNDKFVEETRTGSKEKGVTGIRDTDYRPNDEPATVDPVNNDKFVEETRTGSKEKGVTGIRDSLNHTNNLDAIDIDQIDNEEIDNKKAEEKNKYKRFMTGTKLKPSKDRAAKTNVNSFRSRFLTGKKNIQSVQEICQTESDFFVGMKNNVQMTAEEMSIKNIPGVSSITAGKYMIFAKGSGKELMKSIFDEDKMIFLNDNTSKIEKDEIFHKEHQLQKRNPNPVQSTPRLSSPMLSDMFSTPLRTSSTLLPPLPKSLSSPNYQNNSSVTPRNPNPLGEGTPRIEPVKTYSRVPRQILEIENNSLITAANKFNTETITNNTFSPRRFGDISLPNVIDTEPTTTPFRFETPENNVRCIDIPPQRTHLYDENGEEMVAGPSEKQTKTQECTRKRKPVQNLKNNKKLAKGKATGKENKKNGKKSKKVLSSDSESDVDMDIDDSGDSSQNDVSEDPIVMVSKQLEMAQNLSKSPYEETRVENLKQKLKRLEEYEKLQNKNKNTNENIEVLETPLLEGNGTYQGRGKDKIQKVNQERLKAKKEQMKKGKEILNTQKDILRHIDYTDTESNIDDNSIVPGTPQKQTRRRPVRKTAQATRKIDKPVPTAVTTPKRKRPININNI